MASYFTSYTGNNPNFVDIQANMMIPPGGPGNVTSFTMPADKYGFVRMTSIVFTTTGATTVTIFNADIPTLKFSVSASSTSTNTNPQPMWIVLCPGNTMRIAYQSSDTTSVTRVNYEILTFNT